MCYVPLLGLACQVNASVKTLVYTKIHLAARRGVLGKQVYIYIYVCIFFMQHHHLRDDVGGRLGVTVSRRVRQKRRGPHQTAATYATLLAHIRLL